jgi:lipopolysaccharide/colanic/teichoic acid biosynthesis glycosyltransferase
VDLNAQRTLETGITVGSIEVYQPLPLGKRAFDIVVSLVGLFVALPLLLLLCSWVWLVDGRPVLFQQIRVGHRGRHFPLYKIRTVRSSSGDNPHFNHAVDFISSNKTMTKIDGCLDIIPLGQLLRASGLDELPQIFNILKGEMSLIGPRPCLPYEEERYRPWHRRRFEAHPGVSGLWQVSGKNRLTFDSMVRLDILYERMRSPLTDLSIIAKTPWVIVEELIQSRTTAFH